MKNERLRNAHAMGVALFSSMKESAETFHELEKSLRSVGQLGILEKGELIVPPAAFKSGGIVLPDRSGKSFLPTYLKISCGELLMNKLQRYNLGKAIGKKNPRKSMSFKALKKKVL